MSQAVDPWTISAPELIFGFDGQDASAPAPAISPPPANGKQIQPPAPELSLAELMLQFESFGDNCEFGLVQRYVGVEPLGLFRFSYEKMSELLAVVENRFSSLKAPGAVEVYFYEQGKEYMVRLNPHGFEYHTYIFGRDKADPEVLQTKEVRRVAFLADKLIDDLENGEKILVRKGEGSETEADAARLLEGLLCHGPNTLLWVVPADADHPPGTVEVARPHLLRGYISRFAPYDNAYDLALADWLDICAGAYRLWKSNPASGTRIDPPPRRSGANLIDDAATLAGGGWHGENQGQTALCPPPLRPDSAIMVHALTEKTDYRTGFVWAKSVPQGVIPGEIHTISAWVYIPSNFRGTNVGMVCGAFPSLRLSNAKLSIRDRWQQAWVSARVPDDRRNAYPGIIVVGEPGDVVYSTCWKLEAGVVPTPEP